MSAAKAYTLIGADGRTCRSLTRGTLGGHREGRLYGRLDCPSALRAIARGGYVKERVFFVDEATAIAAGYRPCARCLPQPYAVWKAGQAAFVCRGVASTGSSGYPVAQADIAQR